MFTINAEVRKDRVKVRAAACVQQTNSQLSFTVAKKLQFPSNWTMILLRTWKLNQNSTAKQ